MTFVSYAKNFEDVMLWRALKHIINGFYIDMGSGSPTINSVTHAFYEAGWYGINIKPNLCIHAQFVAIRHRDINLHIANDTSAPKFDDILTHNCVHSWGAADKQELEVFSLAHIWGQYIPDGQEVHFLIIDPKKLVDVILQGNELSKYRPWIIVVEAILPLSYQENHEEWVPLLRGYRFAYTDGLNRFYVANEHFELLPSFKYPPNTFDDFELNIQYQAEAQLEQAKIQARNAEDKALELKNEVDRLNNEIQIVYSSRSWRITYPLRVGFCAFLRVLYISSSILQSLMNRLADQLSFLVVHLIHFARSHPKFKEWALFWIRKYPKIGARLQAILLEKAFKSGRTSTNNLRDELYMPSFELKRLSPKARSIYEDLKNSLEGKI